MAYELEWQYDSLLVYLSDENIPDYIYTDQKWNDSDYYIKLSDDIDYSDKMFKFCLVSDGSFGYRGVQINQIRILMKDEFLEGDINLDLSVDIFDILLIVNIILGLEVSESQILASDLNNDNLINVNDIIMLIEIIFE